VSTPHKGKWYPFDIDNFSRDLVSALDGTCSQKDTKQKAKRLHIWSVARSLLHFCVIPFRFYTYHIDHQASHGQSWIPQNKTMASNQKYPQVQWITKQWPVNHGKPTPHKMVGKLVNLHSTHPVAFPRPPRPPRFLRPPLAGAHSFWHQDLDLLSLTFHARLSD